LTNKRAIVRNLKRMTYNRVKMPVCYVVVNTQNLQVLCVFFDQIKARRFVGNYSDQSGSEQHIVTFTSWLDDELSSPNSSPNSRPNLALHQLDRFS